MGKDVRVYIYLNVFNNTNALYMLVDGVYLLLLYLNLHISHMLVLEVVACCQASSLPCGVKPYEGLYSSHTTCK